MNTTKDHFHDDFIFLKLPEFSNPSVPSKCGGILGIKCFVTMKMAYFKR